MPAAEPTSTPKATATAPSTISYVIDTAQKSGEQLLDAYLQAAKFTLDAGAAWMSTLSSLPFAKPASDSAPTAVKATAERLVSASFAMVDHAVKVQKELSGQALALMDA
jgi:hypothetical protein